MQPNAPSTLLFKAYLVLGLFSYSANIMFGQVLSILRKWCWRSSYAEHALDQDGSGHIDVDCLIKKYFSFCECLASATFFLALWPHIFLISTTFSRYTTWTATVSSVFRQFLNIYISIAHVVSSFIVLYVCDISFGRKRRVNKWSEHRE